MNKNLTEQMNIIIYGSPNYDNLTKAEKRLLLLPLVETIKDFYKDPENRRKFEQWKKENAPA